MALRRKRATTRPLAPLPNAPAVNLCHPEWRGVRTASFATGYPVIESSDLSTDSDSIIQQCLESDIPVVIVQGWPPGAEAFCRSAHKSGLRVIAVSHSSLAQHTAEAGEAAAIEAMVKLTHERAIAQLGFVKAGIAEVFHASGIPAIHVPNRTPVVETFQEIDLGEGTNVGVFAEPVWRKNLGTQLGATHLLGFTAHILQEPVGIPFVPAVRTHGLADRNSFLSLLASTDLNMYVSLSECHPLTPIESYLVGVPCLMSQTSDVFRSNEELWDLTTVGELDNPRVLATAVEGLISSGPLAIEMAHAWIQENDARARQSWKRLIA